MSHSTSTRPHEGGTLVAPVVTVETTAALRTMTRRVEAIGGEVLPLLAQVARVTAGLHAELASVPRSDEELEEAYRWSGHPELVAVLQRLERALQVAIEGRADAVAPAGSVD